MNKSFRREEKQWPPARTKRLVDAWNVGVSPRDLSERFGITPGAIRYQLNCARTLGLNVAKRAFRSPR